MSDVFLSYKAEDRARVRPLAAALEAEGLSVWWDTQIEGGAAWRHSIQEQLDAARCVIVVWSRNSVGPEGRFVHDEASHAQQRGVYLPILLDKVKPPLGFGETQALPLTGWRGDGADPRFQALLAAIHFKVRGVHHGSHPARPRRLDRRALVAGGGVVAAGVAGVGGWAVWRGMGAPSDDKSIAVLPFANLSGDPAQTYFADGMAEELRGALARIGQLKVIARASCEAVRDKPIVEAARTLGVTSILTGSVRRSPTLIRVSAQLIDGKNGVERWSETYDRAPGDALQIQTGIAESVASALRVRLGQAEKAALTVGGTNNAAAHDLVLKAIELGRTDDTEAGARKRLALLDAAIALDPNYAEAYAERSAALGVLVGAYAANAADLRAGYAQATESARRAVALAPQWATAHTTLGKALENQLDMRSALSEHERANGFVGANDAGNLVAYARFLGHLGRGDEAVALAARAVALDPLNIGPYAAQSLILFYARRYADAAAAARRVLAQAPRRVQTQTLLGDCLVMMGKLQEAQAEYAKAPADDAFRLTGEAMVAALMGDRVASDSALARMKQVFGDVASYQYGEIHAQRGEIDQAFADLDKAWEVRDGGMLGLRVDPFIDPLRGDPRFRAIETRMNYPS